MYPESLLRTCLLLCLVNCAQCHVKQYQIWVKEMSPLEEMFQFNLNTTSGTLKEVFFSSLKTFFDNEKIARHSLESALDIATKQIEVLTEVLLKQNTSCTCTKQIEVLKEMLLKQNTTCVYTKEKSQRFRTAPITTEKPTKPTTVPRCSLTCEHGSFNSAACTCSCYSGWEGPRCDVQRCSLTCEHGYLHSTDCFCNCYIGWAGTICEGKIETFYCEPRNCRNTWLNIRTFRRQDIGIHIYERYLEAHPEESITFWNFDIIQKGSALMTELDRYIDRFYEIDYLPYMEYVPSEIQKMAPFIVDEMVDFGGDREAWMGCMYAISEAITFQQERNNI